MVELTDRVIELEIDIARHHSGLKSLLSGPSLAGRHQEVRESVSPGPSGRAR
jgi:hypothetical protein